MPGGISGAQGHFGLTPTFESSEHPPFIRTGQRELIIAVSNGSEHKELSPLFGIWYSMDGSKDWMVENE
jgi:hypothetical protein